MSEPLSLPCREDSLLTLEVFRSYPPGKAAENRTLGTQVDVHTQPPQLSMTYKDAAFQRCSDTPAGRAEQAESIVAGHIEPRLLPCIAHIADPQQICVPRLPRNSYLEHLVAV